MGSLHIPPPAAGNARSDDSASSSSNSRYTPVSNDPEEQEQEEYDYSASRLGKAPMGNLRLQTDFEEDAETGEPVSEDEDNRYDSDEDIEGKTGRAVDGPKYTPDEEKEVVSVFAGFPRPFKYVCIGSLVFDDLYCANWRKKISETQKSPVYKMI
jgi:hypothetical protein